MAKSGDILVGLDIGTTKICAIVGEVTDDGIDIIGIGTHPSKGLRKGVVVNIDATVAVDQARRRGGRADGRLRDHARSTPASPAATSRRFNSHGIVAVKDKEVREADVDRVIDAGQGGRHPAGPRGDPRPARRSSSSTTRTASRSRSGMTGVRLEAKVHIVTGAVTSAQNIVKCANRTRPQRRRHRARAARLGARRCSREDEKELGVCLVDIGGGTTDIAIFSDGAHRPHRGARRSAATTSPTTSPSGCARPPHEAERIKQQLRLRHGVDGGQGRDHRGAQSVGGRAAARRSRGRSSARSSSRASRRSSSSCTARSRSAASRTCSPAGVVITGGSTLLDGMPELAEEVLGMPVRRGMPHGHRRPGRRGEEPDVRDRRGARASTARSTPDRRLLPDPRGERLPQGPGPDAGVARGDLLATTPLQGCAENLRAGPEPMMARIGLRTVDEGEWNIRAASRPRRSW